MSAFPCPRCGCMFIFVGTYMQPCGCAELDERLKLVGVLVARIRRSATYPLSQEDH